MGEEGRAIAVQMACSAMGVVAVGEGVWGEGCGVERWRVVCGWCLYRTLVTRRM